MRRTFSAIVIIYSIAAILFGRETAVAADRVDLRCGAYCLFVALSALDKPPQSFEELEKELGQPSVRGYSMEQLADVAKSFGASTLGVETSLDHLERRSGRFACVALLEDTGHYVCISGLDDASVSIVDPPTRRQVARPVFDKLWRGKALLISDQPIDPRLPNRVPIWVWPLTALAILFVAAFGVQFIRRKRAR